jgi:hypothetical protein
VAAAHGPEADDGHLVSLDGRSSHERPYMPGGRRRRKLGLAPPAAADFGYRLLMSSQGNRSRVERQMKDVRDLFAEPLAARLGRTAAEIRDEGLSATDFKPGERVELTLCDRSTMSLRYAFAVLDPAQRIVGVFTEHCGYYCFAMADLELVELRDDVVVARHSW